MSLLPQLPDLRMAEMLESLSRQRPSPAGALLSAAALAIGVVWLAWPPAVLFGFFWLENAVGGLFFLWRLLGLRGAVVSDNLRRALEGNDRLDPGQRQRQLDAAAGCMHWIAPGFFLLHYGLFCAGHLALVMFFFPDWASGFATPGGLLAIAAMLGGMGWDTRQFRRREDIRALPRMVYMLTCYDRVLVMHLGLVGAGLVLMLLGGQWLALLLIGIKLGFDLQGGLSLSRILARHLRQKAAGGA